MTQDDAAVESGRLNRRQGHFGEELISTLAAAGGVGTARPNPDVGFDLVLEHPDGDIARLQIKTTRNTLVVNEGYARYRIDVDTYERLRKPYSAPAYLIVVEVPAEPADWVSCTNAEYQMRRRARYLSLSDEPEQSNTASVTVSLPLGNMVTPETLRAMVEDDLR